MTKDHFAHVSEHFNLVQYSVSNRPDVWEQNREGAVVSSTLRVDQFGYRIGIHGQDMRGRKRGIYVWLPNMQLAEEILQYIKSTEILFV